MNLMIKKIKSVSPIETFGKIIGNSDLLIQMIDIFRCFGPNSFRFTAFRESWFPWIQENHEEKVSMKW